jgi:hypothetical protein
MNKFFEVGVRYDKTMDNGVTRKVTENYLIEAVSFSEAEVRATIEMTRHGGESEVVTEKIVNVSEVVTAPTEDGADKFYKVKHNIVTMDEKTAKEKMQPQYILVQAASIDDARERYKRHISTWVIDTVLEAIGETKIVDFFK